MLYEFEEPEADADLQHSAQLRRQIESDDPDLVTLQIGDDCYRPPDGDWERDGKSIGNNTHIKELMIWGVDEITKEDFEDFFRGFCCNRSTHKLSFCGCHLFEGEIFRILVPFFKSNHNCKYLGITGCDLGHDAIRLLASALTEFKSLKEFEFSRIDDNGARQLIERVTGHHDILMLRLYVSQIGRNAGNALASLLQNPKSQLAVLHLSENQMDNEVAAILARGLAVNSTLRDLDLSWNRDISVSGWRAVFEVLQSPTCRIEKLSLRGNHINDDAALSLARTLSNSSRHLKSLNLANIGDPHITTAGWLTLLESLQSPSCALEELDLSGNGIRDEAAIVLSSSLANTRSLKRLNISGNTEITMEGWQAFSTFLQSPQSFLETLDLSFNGFNDEAVDSLTNTLVNGHRVREIDLSHNEQVTPAGWEGFAAVLRNPQSALEKLDLRGNIINDGVMSSLATSLINNIMLKELLIHGRRPNVLLSNAPALTSQVDLLTLGSNITANGWAAFSQVLCNSSSIIGTYNSNHTLQTLCEMHDEDALPEDLRSFLRQNQENSRSQAARRKIIKIHFREGFAVEPFVDMEWNVLPHAIAWVGRDGQCNELNEHFYNLLRSIAPLLFDINRKTRKRKLENNFRLDKFGELS